MLALVFAAKVWHYWLIVPLFFGAVLVTVGIVIGYLIKVQGPRYPKRGQPVRR